MTTERRYYSGMTHFRSAYSEHEVNELLKQGYEYLKTEVEATPEQQRAVHFMGLFTPAPPPVPPTAAPPAAQTQAPDLNALPWMPAKWDTSAESLPPDRIPADVKAWFVAHPKGEHDGYAYWYSEKTGWANRKKSVHGYGKPAEKPLG